MGLRFNQYRVMWLMVMFDLPTETKKDRRNYAQFRKRMLASGFSMFQFSIYLRHCSSRENMHTHIRRVRRFLPPQGKVGILQITDRQFGLMELYYGKEEAVLPSTPQQLELF